MVGALAGLLAVLWGLPFPLALMPEPIGPAAVQFGEGARMTVLLTLTSGGVGLLVGIAVALARLARQPWLQHAAGLYVWIMRGTPLLVQILFVYFTLPALLPGLELSGFWSAVLALSANVGAYNSEVIRAGILAIPRGQREAAQALGLGPIQVLLLVVLPQAVRLSLPPLVNNIVALLKDSSLAYVIGVVELSLVGNRVQAESFRPVPVFITVAGVYLALTTFLTAFSHALEQRLARSAAR
ncbi:amino acid ABC transporter permease [Rhodoligotrophos defluvii]|uniref:amino acid ABC transporter permease n=1 Tax=Rhodoligotrophos defluvii TaxID=2561934 RepID=UPI0010C99AC3|nr:amino acid ABC transporter permease [Rhodoligotrophos defluvii]